MKSWTSSTARVWNPPCANISDSSRAELRGDQTRLSGHRRRRRLRDSGSQRYARSDQEQEGPQEVLALRQTLRLGVILQMKTPFVTDLNTEQSITTFFLVNDKV